MNARRYDRNRNSLFDSLEEGSLRPTSSYSTSEIAEQENDRGIDSLSDRVNVLKILTNDIHDEVDSHNRMLGRMEQDMDSSREYFREQWIVLRGFLKRREEEVCSP